LHTRVLFLFVLLPVSLILPGCATGLRMEPNPGPLSKLGSEPLSVKSASIQVAAAPKETTTDVEDFGSLYDDLESEKDITSIADPLEPFNRAMFKFNDKLYFYMIKPIARGLRIVLPKPVRVSVANFFFNLTTPVRFTNSVLQGKMHDALNEFGRFMINTTAGIGGLFDPAKKYAGLTRKEEDLGQTLAVYGLGHGFYLFIPLIGPTSLRDGIGMLGDLRPDPRVYFTDDRLKIGLYVIDEINKLSLDKDTYESIKNDSLDPYLTIRAAYAQLREARVKE